MVESLILEGTIVVLKRKDKRRLFGYEREELVEKSIELLITRERLRDQTQNPHTGILEERAISMEKGRDSYFSPTKDGREFPRNQVPQLDGPTNPGKLLICFRDISDRKRADMAREQLAAIDIPAAQLSVRPAWR